MSKSLFISFEGGDGTGKTTIINELAKYYKKNNIPFLKTREPGEESLAFAQSIRQIIFDNTNIEPLTEAFLFQADRHEHVEKIIKPALAKGEIVLCDRFIDSSVVYQGILGLVSPETISMLNLLSTSGLKPDITFLFNIDPLVSFSRLNNNNREINKFDQRDIDYHQKINDAYLEIAKYEKRFVLIDANKDIMSITNQVIKIISEWKKDTN